MPQAQAERFAKCLRANRAFGNAFVAESHTAKSDRRFYVAYHPSNPERCAELLDGERGKREVKALTEGHGYLFLKSEDAEFWFCLSTSGEVYEVHPLGCTCPDWEFRARGAGIPCKHVLALINDCGTRLERAQVFGGCE